MAGKVTRGIFVVRKPCGITSADVTNKLRAILVAGNDKDAVGSGEIPKSQRRRQYKHSSRSGSSMKVGHGGTLDKSAEGVLVIGLGKDCKKLSSFLHKVDKGYTVTGVLGVTTDTLDGCGNVTEEKPWEHVTKQDLDKVLVDFQGESVQVPPLYSALKSGGIRFSDRAREATAQGVACDVMPEPRQVTIHSLTVTDFNPPRFTIEVSCGSGTYMRSLVRDIGTKLGTVAHMEYLCRTQQGPFSIEDALCQRKWTVSDIEAAIEKCGTKLVKKEMH